MIDGLNHVGTDHKCTICQCDFTDDEGGIQGYLGILPVAFCPTCFSGLCDMVEQLNDREWEGLTRMELIKCGVLPFGMSYELYEAIEAKLKEKNYDRT